MGPILTSTPTRVAAPSVQERERLTWMALQVLVLPTRLRKERRITPGTTALQLSQASQQQPHTGPILPWGALRCCSNLRAPQRGKRRFA